METRSSRTYQILNEIFNAITHGIGVGLSIAALVLLILKGVASGSALAVTAFAIYGASLVMLFLFSTLAHSLHFTRAVKVFRVFDHNGIYLLIAGTYTPVTLTALRPQYPVQAFVIFGIVWACCFIAATLTAIDLKKYQILSMICYLAMGWCIIFFIKPTVQCLGTGGTVFLFTGGVAYTIGAILYGIGKKKKYVHSIFHLFVVAGSILHFFMILFYVIL